MASHSRKVSVATLVGSVPLGATRGTSFALRQLVVWLRTDIAITIRYQLLTAFVNWRTDGAGQLSIVYHREIVL